MQTKNSNHSNKNAKAKNKSTHKQVNNMLSPLPANNNNKKTNWKMKQLNPELIQRQHEGEQDNEWYITIWTEKS